MFTLCLATALVAQTPDLNGIWEIQSLGADRTVRVESSGESIAIHRVMHPEFEGKTYRLDHLYRGTIDGDDIRGKLLVKDDELPDFEVLRSFEGSIKDGKLVIDGMPLLRNPDAKGDEIAMLPTRARKMKTETKKTKRRYKKRRRRGVERGKTQKTEKAPPTTIVENDEPSGSGLYDQILGGGDEDSESMIRVSREIDIPDEGQDALEAGRTAFETGDYPGALEALERANALGAGGLTHRYLGLTLNRMGRHAEALPELKRALRMDPTDQVARDAYAESKAAR